MWGLRDLVKAGAVIHSRMRNRSIHGAVSILMYHRVTGDTPLEIDLAFDLFERQIRWLAQTGEVIEYGRAVAGLLSNGLDGPLKYAITFDDAYEDFYFRAWPILRRHGLPAILFVPTRYIDDPDHLPLSKEVADPRQRLKPMTWGQLREVSSDPLITIGGHTHTHPNLDTLSEEAIVEEMTRSADRFRLELGFIPGHFAYPRGRWNYRVMETVKPYCESAAIVGGAIATNHNTDRYAVPRIPIRSSDGWKWFVHRARGRLYGEERMVTLAKRLLRRTVSDGS